ncbi:hypothetical protein ALC60_04117 [Trachymyrmex zeteki]|uniref:Uncharacterized protein n=1 Tax=Mycetomoellerius zeteki TaxID=64791 RepID=A0A151X971_9HYME|nr:hypothetical protein ALC60_04117 [Trachymyrmex zeteki]
MAQFEKNPTRSHNTRISLRFTKVSQDNHPRWNRNELCRHSLVDSAFSTVAPRPNAVSQGRRRQVHRPTMTGRRSRRSCLFETSTSSSDHEMIQLSDSLRALRTCQNYDQSTKTHKNNRQKKIGRMHVFRGIFFFFHQPSSRFFTNFWCRASHNEGNEKPAKLVPDERLAETRARVRERESLRRGYAFSIFISY